MQVISLSLRDFRGYHDAHVEFGDGLTVVTGPNGAGKTNLLEGLYFGCTGRSCRTNNEREVVRFGAGAARTVLTCGDEDGHARTVGRLRPRAAEGACESTGRRSSGCLTCPSRPLVSVFLPDRLELIKGAPALRRAHLDQFVAALWPARTETRRLYAQALAQRNALIARIRSGRGSRERARELGCAVGPSRDRADERPAQRGGSGRRRRSSGSGRALGLEGDPKVFYRPRSRAADPESWSASLRERVDGDLERGFTGHGPHRDDLATDHGGHDLRAYGSQGQQRLALLALLLAEREVIGELRPAPAADAPRRRDERARPRPAPARLSSCCAPPPGSR